MHRNYTVTGDAVNLAARLLELAHAGETVISDDVYRECVSSIEVDHVGTMPIRGFAHEMPVWRLRSLRMETGPEHPLLGRDQEIARFEAMLQVPIAGKQFVMVLLLLAVPLKSIVNDCKFALNIDEMGQCRTGFLKQGAASEFDTFLWEIANRDFSPTMNGSRVRFQLLIQQAKECSFARAVGADQAYTVSHA